VPAAGQLEPGLPAAPAASA